MMMSLPIAVTADNIDFVLNRAPEIVFLRFPDYDDDEPVYRDRAYAVLHTILGSVKSRVVYTAADRVFAIKFE